MHPGYEVLIGDHAMAARGKRMLEALLRCPQQPPNVFRSSVYTGTRKVLMMYGAGLDSRRFALTQHLNKGGRAVIWDLGYWERDDHMRLSIDALHPVAKHLALAPPAPRSRFAFQLREDANPAGPILLIGLGVKSAALYKVNPMEWERRKAKELQQRFPGRTIKWRPKGTLYAEIPGTDLCRGGTIEEALQGCSLVVCRHSNVGVDACIAGVPVETEDGAALALYKGNPTPTVEQRTEFLRQLGWWNWKPEEAPHIWKWIERVLA